MNDQAKQLSELYDAQSANGFVTSIAYDEATNQVLRTEYQISKFVFDVNVEQIDAQLESLGTAQKKLETQKQNILKLQKKVVENQDGVE